MSVIYKNQGILDSKAISTFKGSLVTSTLKENSNKFLKWMGLKSYPTIDFSTISIPDSQLAKRAIEEANELYTPSLLKHCYRTYFFSLGLAKSQTKKVDEEFLFTTSILHDIGLTDKHNHVCSEKCFAVFGGDFVKDFATKQGVDQIKAHQMQVAVEMHLDPTVPSNVYGNEAHFLSKGAAMDVIGAHSFQLSDTFIDSVHHLFPRAQFKENILKTMTELNHKPHTRADILFKMGFQKLASKNRLDHR